MGGVGMMVFGVMREHRRERLGKPHGLHLPQIDLNNPRHRTAFVSVAIGGITLLLFSAFGSFKAYEYTESDQFCGETCHTVMEPEYTAYQFSPHAKVGCVQCHIGSGADWFVKAKISGSYQLYAVAFDKYPKPIPTPIENLRPAQGTCEQCHWPKHFFSEKQQTNTYFLADDKNTRWDINLLMKIGGGNVEAGPTSGIHWHMNIGHEVTYKALDRERQVIPWVRSRSLDGEETIYRNPEIEVSEDSLAGAFTRRMDCIDCHNRPSHIFARSVERGVNSVLASGGAPKDLPFLKREAVAALKADYSSQEEAGASIERSLTEFYKKQYPSTWTSRQKDIERTIASMKVLYSRNIFPEMKVTWGFHPDNRGHMEFPGCFRCHDDNHKSKDGKVIRQDCELCHEVL
jgi:NapC/NirT cytochrome c family, N-terminal region